MAISIADSSSSSPRSSLAFLLDPEQVELPRSKQSMWHRLGLRRWLGRDDRDFSSRSPKSASSDPSPPASNDRSKGTNSPPPKSHDNLTRRLSRRVGVGLPRSTTFKRQHSERRDRLSPINLEPRPRAVSADRRTLSLQRTKSPQSVVDPRLSAPEINWPRDDPDPGPNPSTRVDELPEANEEIPQNNDVRSEWDHFPQVTDTPEGYPVDIFDMELERRWILNLSMHFRDRSEREKFFVTYAEAANRWRRVTISCDYRDAEPESLEQDLKELRYQRDKCARIYESIRESLPEIQFYDTVTNLKLETRDGRLHVHVTEDVNEIIPYPPISSIGHIPEARLVPERRLHFEAHLSGFVYNVRLGDRSFIKKEIPGPDTVDEFLYEINALHALQGTPNVIQVEGVVVDDREEVVKGLLISFAEKGALVDILYEYRGTISWERRERWARQIVHGLSEIHETGYVQGDFTLSNIVVDANDDAKIIDINRRGCPVGWEPPEIAAKIESNQRISMYIGVKTDLFQLGMTLWALAMEEDEPERQPRPFVLDESVPVPDYYRRLVSICLSPVPRQRLSAKELLSFFPPEIGTFEQLPRMQPHTSIGVGLHNGALPLYDSRAAFLYPRGRQMGSFGHSNIQIPYQPHNDSFDSISSPETDEAFVDRGEQERRPELYNMATQPNGVRKSESIIFDERNNVDDMIPMRLTPHPDGQQYRRSPPLKYEEDDFGVDPRYRSSSTDMTMVDPISNAEPFSGELVGVGPWKIPSRNNSVQYHNPEQLATTQASADIYPLDSVTETQSSQEPLQAASTRLQSALPINPATEIQEKLVPLTAGHTEQPRIVASSNLTSENSQQIVDQQSTRLSESSLPINPAIKALEKTAQKIADHEPRSHLQSTFELPQHGYRNLRLSDSLLPINPAARLPETEPVVSESERASNLQAETFECHEQAIQERNPDLIESRLPINPATGSSSSSDPSTTAPSASRNEPNQDSLQDTEDQNLISSRLPISAATVYPVETPDYNLDATAAPELSFRCTQQITQDHNQNALLRNSYLSANTTTIALGEALSHGVDMKQTLNAQPIFQDENQSSFLSNSHLPINPAAKCSTEGLASQHLATMPSTEAQPISYPQHSVDNRTPHLNDSHLPINPAFTDKVLQPV
ncbi:hypothetical protein BDW74DRAFT_49124 [Aspergillus multicolor]|uniref:protein kinase family protein n=1 Tax=Aspergillus multicolor TaxID=41759 RepID=UPI003CCE1D18